MKQRADGRWRKVKRINGKNIDFYSNAKTEKAALRDIESQMLKYTENLTRNKKKLLLLLLILLTVCKEALRRVYFLMT